MASIGCFILLVETEGYLEPSLAAGCNESRNSLGDTKQFPGHTAEKIILNDYSNLSKFISGVKRDSFTDFTGVT